MTKERLTELLAFPYSDILASSELQSELTQYYKLIYNQKTCSSCKNKFNKYYQQLMIDGIEKMTQTTSNFKLRTDTGVLQINFENGLFISQTHAADEVCIEFLKANPKRISLFEIYPENWMDLINQNNEQENENE